MLGELSPILSSLAPVKEHVTVITNMELQNAYPGTSDRVHQPEDTCGFWLQTPDGTIWAPGTPG